MIKIMIMYLYGATHCNTPQHTATHATHCNTICIESCRSRSCICIVLCRQLDMWLGPQHVWHVIGTTTFMMCDWDQNTLSRSWMYLMLCHGLRRRNYIDTWSPSCIYEVLCRHDLESVFWSQSHITNVVVPLTRQTCWARRHKTSWIHDGDHVSI